ncbi:MAG: ATP F0F1 synthase subunit I, partial [Mesorhizobium sp.]
MAGTSPWGLIVFLLLGFGAGVLNVMRSAGVVAEFGQGAKPRRDRDDGK